MDLADDGKVLIACQCVVPGNSCAIHTLAQIVSVAAQVDIFLRKYILGSERGGQLSKTTNPMRHVGIEPTAVFADLDAMAKGSWRCHAGIDA